MGVVTMIVTLLMFSTGFIPCYQMYKTKSTRNVPFHMFLLGTLGCLGMFHYGLMVENGILIFLNGVGAILQAFYTFLYVLIVKSKTWSFLLLFMALLYDAILYTYLYQHLETVSARADTLGSASSLLTTFLMVLPAFEVVSNIRNKNAEGMPPVMLIGGIICSSCWLIYGVMLNDPNIYSPNIPGIFISAVKLYMIFLYGGKEKRMKKKD